MNNDRNFKNAIEAANALKDLIAEARGIRKDLAADLKKIKEEAREEVRDYIDGQVSIRLNELNQQTRKAMDQATARVVAEMERLQDLCLTGGKKDDDNLEDLIKQYTARHGAMRVPTNPSKIKKPN